MVQEAKQPLIFVGLIVAALFLWVVVDVLLLVFGAILMATVLRALADVIERFTPLAGRWSLLLAIALVIGGLGLAGYLFGAEVRGQITQLRTLIPQAWSNLQTQLAEFGWFEALQSRLNDQLGGMRGVLSSLRWVATSVLGVTLNLLLITFGAIYIAAQPGLYKAGVLALIPPKVRGRATEALDACGGALRLWLVGQLIAMLIVGVLTGLGLWMVGLPSALTLGIIAGIAEFVPIVGPILAAVPGLLLALSSGPEMVLWVLLVYVGVQQIENNLIMPIVQRRAVSLAPALLLFAVVAMSVVFGPLGLLFATPLTVVAYVLTKKLYIEDTLHEKTHVPGEDPPGAARARSG